jgi:hypothetical protein
VDFAVLALHCCAEIVGIELEALLLLLAVPAILESEIVEERWFGAVSREGGEFVLATVESTFLLSGGTVWMVFLQRISAVTLLVLVVVRLSIDVEHAAFAFASVWWSFIDRLELAVIAIALIWSSCC